MTPTVVLPTITSLLAFVFALALLDQWRERRRGYQLAWAIGMVFFAIASGCEAIAGAAGWNGALYRTWYLTGAIWNVGWLGLGTAFLLARTRFGYTYATCLALAGILTVVTQAKFDYPGAGSSGVIYLVAALGLAVATGALTYFQDEGWPRVAAGGVVAITLLGAFLMATATIAPPGFSLDQRTLIPTGDALPGTIRLLTPLMNVTGGLSLILGALFSAYVFMPKRRVLYYTLDPSQSGDVFLFNLLIAPVAIVVNFVASLPGAVQALFGGRLHSRVPATILIAIGAIVASSTDSLNRFGSTALFQAGKLVALVLIFAGFLVSIEVFRQLRIPFTPWTLGGRRREASATAEPLGAARTAGEDARG